MYVKIGAANKRLSSFLIATLSLAIGSILLSCTSLDSTEDDPRTAELYVKMGTGHLSEGRYPQAIKDLRRAVELDSSNPLAQNNLGIAYYARRRFKDAEKHFLQALDIKPDYSEARNNLGRTYTEMDQDAKALEQFRIVQADLTYTQPEKTSVNIGLVYLKQRHYSQAIKSFQAALRTNRLYCPAHNYYGQALFLNKQYQKAAAALDGALELCKNLDEAHYYNALSYIELGQYSKAETRLREVLNLYPGSPSAEKARAKLIELTGERN